MFCDLFHTSFPIPGRNLLRPWQLAGIAKTSRNNSSKLGHAQSCDLHGNDLEQGRQHTRNGWYVAPLQFEAVNRHGPNDPDLPAEAHKILREGKIKVLRVSLWRKNQSPGIRDQLTPQDRAGRMPSAFQPRESSQFH